MCGYIEESLATSSLSLSLSHSLSPPLQLGPNVYVGAGVVIGAGARVREAIILDRAVIQVSTTRLTGRGS